MFLSSRRVRAASTTAARMTPTANTRSAEKNENGAEDTDAPKALRRMNFLGVEDAATVEGSSVRDSNSDRIVDPKAADDAVED